MLTRIGVPQKFRSWIKVCIETPSFAIMINGAAHGYFNNKRGIRQGDTMSPYLFVLVIDMFSDIIKNAVDGGDISLHQRCADPVITHLSFADDLIAFFYGDENSARGFKAVLEKFRVCSGLQVNVLKSLIFCAGMSDQQAENIYTIVDFNKGELPVRYLGLPLITKKLCHADCMPLLERVIARVQCWKGKYLSYAGRLQLVKSVLTRISIFRVAAFFIPAITVHAINRICRNFLWSGPDCNASHALVGWDDLLFPYDEGGLAIRDVAVVNRAALLRHVWNLLSVKDILRVQRCLGVTCSG